MVVNLIGAGLFMTTCVVFFLCAVLVCSPHQEVALAGAPGLSPDGVLAAPPLLESLIRAPYRLQVCADREDSPDDDDAYPSELARFTKAMRAWSDLDYEEEDALPLYNQLFGNPELLEEGSMTIDELLFVLERRPR